MANRQKKVLTVLGLGTVILAWRGYALFEKYAPSTAEAVDVTIAAPVMSSASQSSANSAFSDLLKKQAEAAKHPWGRNPFMDVPWVVKNKKPEPVPETTSQEAPPAPQLQFVGTSKSQDQWLAAIQGDIYRVGDSLPQNLKIIRITRHTLTVEFEGWTYTYRAGETGAIVSPRQEVNP